MATTPKDSDLVFSSVLYSNGNRVKDQFILASASILTGLNRIGKATLKFDAGDISKQMFKETDDDTFKPGSKIRLDAGPLGKEKPLFTGNVSRLSIEVEPGCRARMVVECRDCAFPATQGRKNKVFEKKKDSEIIQDVLGKYGSVSVDATSVKHESLIQYACTDWDFALSRADANGLFVLVDNGNIEVKKPKPDASPVLTVTYGVNLRELDAGFSVQDQYPKAEAVSWDPAKQEASSVVGEKPKLNKQGNLSPDDLKGGDSLFYQTAAAIDKESLKAWMSAQSLKAGLARFQGSLLIKGNSDVKPGSLIELSGLGTRFNGNAFVGWVEHLIESNQWTTRIGIGAPASNITEEPDVSAPLAGGWLPGIQGLQIGKVKSLKDDPAKESRILVEFPLLKASPNALWARLCTLYASKDAGFLFPPDIGDEVLVGFLNDDPGNPVILGSLYSSKVEPPEALDDKNAKKLIITKSKIKQVFDDEKKTLTLETPDKVKIELNNEDKSISMSVEKNKITLSKDGIAFESDKDLKLTSKGDIVLEAAGKATLTAKSDVSLSGANVKAEAQAGFTAKGNATAELSASGQTVVKGGVVMIN